MYKFRKKKPTKTYYLCDPNKNTNCKKTVCQVKCNLTEEVKFARLNNDGTPKIVIVL